jgi:hypothetical protein
MRMMVKSMASSAGGFVCEDRLSAVAVCGDGARAARLTTVIGLFVTAIPCTRHLRISKLETEVSTKNSG